MKFIFFLVATFFITIPFVAYAQRYPYDRTDVDAFEITDTGDDESFFDIPTDDGSEESPDETETSPPSDMQDDTGSDLSADDQESDSSTDQAAEDTQQASDDTDYTSESSSELTDETSTEEESFDTTEGDIEDEEPEDGGQQTDSSQESELESSDSSDQPDQTFQSDQGDTQTGEPTEQEEELTAEEDPTEQEEELTAEEEQTLLDRIFSIVSGGGTAQEEETQEVDAGDILIHVSVSQTVASALQSTDQLEALPEIEDIQKQKDLNIFVQSKIFSDANIQDASISERVITTSYKQSARLFGFIPIAYTQKVSLRLKDKNTLQDVSIEKPWWTSLTAGDNTRRLELEIKKEANAILAEGGALSEDDVAGLLQRLGALFSRLVELLKDFRNGLFS